MPIVQDETGTHIFSEMPINSLQEMWDFTYVGMHRFRIDSLFLMMIGLLKSWVYMI